MRVNHLLRKHDLLSLRKDAADDTEQGEEELSHLLRIAHPSGRSMQLQLCSWYCPVFMRRTHKWRRGALLVSQLSD